MAGTLFFILFTKLTTLPDTSTFINNDRFGHYTILRNGYPNISNLCRFILVYASYSIQGLFPLNVVSQGSIYLAALGLRCSVWDLAPWPGTEPRPSALGAESLSRWTTREVPESVNFLSVLYFHTLKIISCMSIKKACVQLTLPCGSLGNVSL